MEEAKHGVSTEQNKRGVRSGEWGVRSGEWGVGSGEVGAGALYRCCDGMLLRGIG
jgi:hypothetical protein